LSGRDNGDYVTKVQYKPNQNCHYGSPVWKIHPNKIFLSWYTLYEIITTWDCTVKITEMLKFYSV
jgi:hypothetical protein